MRLTEQYHCHGLTELQYLTGLTILAAYALHSSHVFSLPIPDLICALTLALPPLAGVGLETVLSINQHLTRKGEVQESRILQVTVVAFIVYEAVLATLAGVHVSPEGSLNCALKERWTRLFSAKDAVSIEIIQDAFHCCGLLSAKDMAWPFPDKTHSSDACMVRYDRTKGCMEPWRAEEQKVAIMLLVVPVAVFLWKVRMLRGPLDMRRPLIQLQMAILLAPSSASTWLPSAIRLPRGDSAPNSRARQAIGYRDGEVDEDSVRAEVDRLNKDSNMASHVEGERRRSQAHVRFLGHEDWRDSNEEA